MKRQQSPQKESQNSATAAPVVRKNPFAGKKVQAEIPTSANAGKDIFSDLGTTNTAAAGAPVKRAFPFGSNSGTMGMKQRKLK